MIIEAFAATNKGSSPTRSERHLIDRELGLHLVAGGSSFSDTPQLAESAKMAIVTPLRERKAQLEAAEKASDWHAIKTLISEALSAANQTMLDTPDGATCVASFAMVLVRGTKAFLANAGDQAIYLWRHGNLTPMSRCGMLRSSNTKSQIQIAIQCLGQETFSAEVVSFNLLPGDKVLIASAYALTPFKEPKQLAQLLSGPPEQTPENLIKEALKTRSDAPISVVVIQAQAPESLSAEEKEQIEADLITTHAVENSKLFKVLDTIERAQVLELCTLKKAKAGELIIKNGDTSTDLCVILSGLVEVARKGITLAQYGAGDYVGEGAFLCGPPRTADVRVISDCRFLTLPLNPFVEFTKAEPIAGMKMVTEMAKVLVSRLEAAWDK